MNLQTWLARGQDLRCFPTRLAQVRYATAWENGDAVHVLRELERVFSRRHRLVALNWLSCPALVRRLDLLNDGPRTFPEDWNEGDFVIQLPGGESVSIAWLADQSAWDELHAAVLRGFLFLPAGEKIRTAKEWLDRATDAYTRRGLSAQALVDAESGAWLLANARPASEALQLTLGQRAASLADLSTSLRQRVATLVAAHADVLRPAPDSAFLTFAALRACQHVFQIDALLARATTPPVQNLMTYLRCQDAPATT